MTMLIQIRVLMRCIIKKLHCIRLIQAWIRQIQGPLKDFPKLFKDLV